MPGNIQGQVGWGSEQPDLVEGVPDHGRGVGLDDLYRSLPNQTVLRFYNSKQFQKTSLSVESWPGAELKTGKCVTFKSITKLLS